MSLLLLTILVVVLLFQSSTANSRLTPALEKVCLSAIRTYDRCNFYTDCLEKLLPCGSRGYALGYGHKYCSRFFADLRRGNYRTDYAQKWVRGTGHCLQQALMDNVVRKIRAGWTCDRIIEYAFDSHPACYTGSVSPVDGVRRSICKITHPLDVKTVFTTVDARDLISKRSMKQISDVMKRCVNTYVKVGFDLFKRKKK